MKDLLKPTGNTPFEIAEAQFIENQMQVRSAATLKELIVKLDECDAMITTWQDGVRDATVTDETRDLAIEALKERKNVLQSIDDLAAVMIALFNLEA